MNKKLILSIIFTVNAIIHMPYTIAMNNLTNEEMLNFLRIELERNRDDIEKAGEGFDKTNDRVKEMEKDIIRNEESQKLLGIKLERNREDIEKAEEILDKSMEDISKKIKKVKNQQNTWALALVCTGAILICMKLLHSYRSNKG